MLTKIKIYNKKLILEKKMGLNIPKDEEKMKKESKKT